MKRELNLVIWPDPILETPAVEVVDFSEMKSLSGKMFKLMKSSGGIGLAAPQAGVGQRIFVMETDKKKRTVINPVVKNSIGSIAIEEGCLSFPGVKVRVDRAGIIDVEYKNEEGIIVDERLQGLDAICFQHELDHLDGKTFVDHLGSMTRQNLRKRLERIKNGHQAGK